MVKRISLVAIALLVRRYYVSGETSTKNQQRLIIFLAIIIGSSVATAVYMALQTHELAYEAQNLQLARLVGSMVIIIIVYCLMALTLCLMQRYPSAPCSYSV